MSYVLLPDFPTDFVPALPSPFGVSKGQEMLHKCDPKLEGICHEGLYCRWLKAHGPGKNECGKRLTILVEVVVSYQDECWLVQECGELCFPTPCPGRALWAVSQSFRNGSLTERRFEEHNCVKSISYT